MDINRRAPVQASATIDIDAPVEVVWNVLTQLASWPKWHPDVQQMEVEGTIEPGTVFRWKASGSTVTSQIQEVVDLRKIAWTGRTLGIKAIHVWQLEPRLNHTQVLTEESFEGILSRLLSNRLEMMLRASLHRGVEALRLESERRIGWKSKIYADAEPRPY